MDKLTKQQEDIICELLHCSYSEEISQFILETIERHNWTRSILASDPSFLNEEQRELYFQLGGGYKMNEVKEYTEKLFENIKHIDEYGNEYWYARELSKVLEYRDWRNFLKVLNKAKEGKTETAIEQISSFGLDFAGVIEEFEENEEENN